MQKEQNKNLDIQSQPSGITKPSSHAPHAPTDTPGSQGSWFCFVFYYYYNKEMFLRGACRPRHVHFILHVQISKTFEKLCKENTGIVMLVKIDIQLFHIWNEKIKG